VPRPYRESLLAPDERVALITRPHALTFWLGGAKALILAIILFAIALVIEQTTILPASLTPARPWITLALVVVAALGLLSVLFGWLRWRAHEIVVTDRRVIRIAGILSKDVIDYSLDAITDLRLRQSWLGRLFGYGDVEILTASEVASRPRETFPVVAGPIAFMHAVQDQRELRRRGAHNDPSSITQPLGYVR
jgi:uncharacterized membrane protein YdbT with pleckstrin-like domain